jgi:hypothetical protein
MSGSLHGGFTTVTQRFVSLEAPSLRHLVSMSMAGQPYRRVMSGCFLISDRRQFVENVPNLGRSPMSRGLFENRVEMFDNTFG